MTNAYESSQQQLQANGIPLHYALTGDHNKPTIALVNPASHNLSCWEPVLADLEQSFQVLRFDIRGTGKSGWGAKTDFTFTQYADDLATREVGIHSLPRGRHHLHPPGVAALGRNPNQVAFF